MCLYICIYAYMCEREWCVCGIRFMVEEVQAGVTVSRSDSVPAGGEDGRPRSETGDDIGLSSF